MLSFKAERLGELFIYFQLSMCCTARGSSAGFSIVGPAKVESLKFFLFTEKFPCIRNEAHLVDFVIIIYSYIKIMLWLCASLAVWQQTPLPTINHIHKIHSARNASHPFGWLIY